jgi:hypothetical protein
METSDGRKQSSESSEQARFQFSDFYAAVTESLPPAKRKANSSRVNRRWSSTTRFIPWIRRCIARFGRGRFGRAAEGGTSETERKTRREKAPIVSLIDKRVKEKLDR